MRLFGLPRYVRDRKSTSMVRTTSSLPDVPTPMDVAGGYFRYTFPGFRLYSYLSRLGQVRLVNDYALHWGSLIWVEIL